MTSPIPETQGRDDLPPVETECGVCHCPLAWSRVIRDEDGFVYCIDCWRDR